MSDNNITDEMLDMFLYETEQMLEQLELVTMASEKEQYFSSDSVNEIFRVMHTIKGSSGIMMMTNITMVSHKLEDVFYFIRQNHMEELPFAELIGMIFSVSDFITAELVKIKAGQEADGDSTEIVEELRIFLEQIKEIQAGAGKGQQKTSAEAKAPANDAAQLPLEIDLNDDGNFYLIHIFYRDDTEMSNVKAYSVVFGLKDIAEDMRYEPLDIDTDEATGDMILKEGFKIAIHTKEAREQVLSRVDHSAGVDRIEVKECDAKEFAHLVRSGRLDFGDEEEIAAEIIEEAAAEIIEEKIAPKAAPAAELSGRAAAQGKKAKETVHAAQSFISVNVEKMDLLMNLIGEMVIAEAVVLQNPDLKVPGLDLTNFNKQSAQLSKITSELQDAIMSIRMMPLTNVFQKMNRIVYDTSRKLGKDIDLKVIGEGTEVDKNIIEHISDPLMHMIRNAVDHGVETKEGRKNAGKPEKGVITLEAKNEGGKVWISVSDDGKGLSRKSLVKKAMEQGILEGREKELSDKEVYNLITLPGFSMKEKVTEYSGRGVGMDVVMKNIQSIGGSLEIDSKEGFGSTMTMKIPLTLAIIDGIILEVGQNTYAIATEDIKEFVRITNDQLIVEPDGTESIMLREECFPVLRLKNYYNLADGFDNVEDGIMAILEYEGKRLALFIDQLVGEQEIVVKPIPSYIKRVKGLSGCMQLGDGSISLILDTGDMINN